MKIILTLLIAFILSACGAGNNNQPQPDLTPLKIYNYVIVGNLGKIYTSDNAESWLSAKIAESSIYNLNAVTSSRDFYVAVGESSTIFYSIDGLNWKTPTYLTASKINLKSVVANNESGNSFTAVGDYGYADIICEYVGTMINSCFVIQTFFLIDSNTSLVDVIINDGNIVAVGNNGLNQLITKNSQNSFTWSLDNRLAILPDSAYSINYLESEYIVLSQNHIYTTNDNAFESNVNKTNNESDLFKLSTLDNTYYAININQQYLMSNDFINWTVLLNLDFIPNNISSIESNIAIVGHAGHLLFGQANNLQSINIDNNCCTLNAISYKKPK